MRIGLNLLHALPEIGGGWNYIENLVNGLGEFGREHTFVAFVQRRSECLVPRKSNWVKVVIGLEAKHRWRRIALENSVLQILAKKYNLDCMHWFGNTMGWYNTVPAVVTVYDLQVFTDLQRNTHWLKRVYLKALMKRTVSRAAALLPMSKSTAEELVRYLGASEKRIRVVPAILDRRFRPPVTADLRQFVDRYQLPDRFWVYVAHLYRHKNHIGLLKAYSHLKRSGYKPWRLVFRGDPGGGEAEVYNAIKDLELTGDILWLPRLAREEMPLLFGAAAGLVFPSIYEGGGIPVLEALGCGCPVVAADLPAVREYGGLAVTYFDPRSVSSIADALRTFEAQGAGLTQRRLAGLERAESFRAERITATVDECYRWTSKG